MFEYHKLGIDIKEDIELPQYNKIIDRDIIKIKKYLDLFLEKNKIGPNDIDTLFLTGGTSLVSAVQELFKNTLPHISIKSDDNFISVAKGLAYSGYLFE